MPIHITPFLKKLIFQNLFVHLKFFCSFRVLFIILLLTDRKVSKLLKAFANNSSANIKLSNTHLFKIVQSEGLLGRLLGPLLKTGLPLMKNVLKPLAKTVLIPLGVTAAAAANPRIHKTILGSGRPLDLAQQYYDSEIFGKTF